MNERSTGSVTGSRRHSRIGRRGYPGNYSQRGKSKVQKGLESLEENARKIKMNKNVSSTRPDENYQSIRTGKERENVKYIDKVKTKSGKIRYIYDINTASGKQRDANDVHDANRKRRQQNARKNLQETYKGLELRNRQTKFGNSPLGKIKGMATQMAKNIKSLSRAVMSAGSTWLKSHQMAKNTKNLSRSVMSTGSNWLKSRFR